MLAFQNALTLKYEFVCGLSTHLTIDYISKGSQIFYKVVLQEVTLTPKGLLNPIWVLRVSITLDEVSIFILSLSNF